MRIDSCHDERCAIVNSSPFEFYFKLDEDFINLFLQGLTPDQIETSSHREVFDFIDENPDNSEDHKVLNKIAEIRRRILVQKDNLSASEDIAYSEKIPIRESLVKELSYLSFLELVIFSIRSMISKGNYFF
ncbi:MAG TPA: hypothetical protein P5048_00535 [Chlamydiales bacterium]|nr:hypothetical protein [Chlamydiales bacterium]